MKKSTKSTLLKIMYIGPFVLGFIAYLKYVGVQEAAYNAIKLYGLSYEKVDDPSVILIIAKWWAPIMAATAVIRGLCVSLCRRISDAAKCRRGALAVYGDNELSELLARKDENGIHRTDEVCEKAQLHIIMFSEDKANLDFYKDNKELFGDKPVYIVLNKVNEFMLKSPESLNVHYLNINDIVARNYWIKEHRLTGEMKVAKEMNIAIIGDAPLTEKMLYFGLLNNIYRRDQIITYHVWGLNDEEQEKYRKFTGDKCALNDVDIHDCIVIEEGRPAESLDELCAMDRIILTDESNLSLAELLLNANSEAQIHWFASASKNYRELYDTDRLEQFGCYDQILSRENIHRESTFAAAESLHKFYAAKYGLPDWTEISAFMREDNVATMDYCIVRMDIMDGKSDLELCELEHVRWMRFRLLHGWTLGEKDNKKKTHPDLVRFEELSEGEQLKDKEIIEKELELLNWQGATPSQKVSD